MLGKQAVPVLVNASYQVWIKELEDGSQAMGIFNMNDKRQTISLNLNDLGIGNKVYLRDLWRKKDLGEFENRL